MRFQLLVTGALLAWAVWGYYSHLALVLMVLFAAVAGFAAVDELWDMRSAAFARVQDSLDELRRDLEGIMTTTRELNDDLSEARRQTASKLAVDELSNSIQKLHIEVQDLGREIVALRTDSGTPAWRSGVI